MSMTTAAVPRSTRAESHAEAPSIGERREQRLRRRATMQRWTKLKGRDQRAAEAEAKKAGKVVSPDVVGTPRTAMCGVAPIGSGRERAMAGVGVTQVGLVVGASGHAYTAGLQHCAAASCPSCQAVIRQERGSDFGEGYLPFL